MKTLELKIPPAIVFLVIAALMWWIAQYSFVLDIGREIRIFIFVVSIILAAILGIGGILHFRQAQTTIHPMNPEQTNTLVTTRIYSITRNPMYLGLMLILIGWAIFLKSPLALLLSFGFAGYMTRFQIVPEENALEILFGSKFSDYKNRVRRWI